MKRRGLVMIAAVALLLGGGTASSAVTTVYVTYPNADGVYSWSTGEELPQPITGAFGPYEDVVVSPAGDIYACDPDPVVGQILRIVPQYDDDGDPIGYTTEPFYDGGGFQCGWFTQYGDLIVTEKYGSGVYFFPAAGGGPQLLVNVPGSTGLEGVTQTGQGDLLVVDRTGGRVARVPFDVNAQYPGGEALGWFDTGNVDGSFITGLEEPVGIARSSRGDVFVSTDDGVFTFGYQEVPDPADPDYPRCTKTTHPTHPCDTTTVFTSIECPVLDLHNQGRPYFLEFDADDVLYISATDRASSKLFSYDHYAAATCTATQIAEVDDDLEALPLVGLAVPYAEPVAGKRATQIGGVPIPPDVQVQNFYDHAYEFRFEPYVGPPGPEPDGYCSVEITAREVDPITLQVLLESADDPENPGFPVAGDPVIYSGENGRGIAYQVRPQDGDPDCGFIDNQRHSINAYTGYVPNPRIVRCADEDLESPVAPNACSLIALNTYYPFNGIFPDDGRISGTTRTSDFSWFFLADVDLEGADTGNGEFCEFQTPFYTPPLPPGFGTYNDPDILDAQYGDGSYFVDYLPMFSTTESVALKFLIAEDPPGDCIAGPFLSGARVLMSIARLRTPDNTPLEPFEPVYVYSAGSSAIEDPAIFNDGGNPNKQYHFNAKFIGYAPGIYQLVLVPLTNNFAAEVRYFRVH